MLWPAYATPPIRSVHQQRIGQDLPAQLAESRGVGCLQGRVGVDSAPGVTCATVAADLAFADLGAHEYISDRCGVVRRYRRIDRSVSTDLKNDAILGWSLRRHHIGEHLAHHVQRGCLHQGRLAVTPDIGAVAGDVEVALIRRDLEEHCRSNGKLRPRGRNDYRARRRQGRAGSQKK